MKRLEAKVHGRVQGVFFRELTKHTAMIYALNGFARNLPDGTVEVIAEGPRKSLEKLLEWLHKGTPASKVEKVEAKWLEPKNDIEGFETY